MDGDHGYFYWSALNLEDMCYWYHGESSLHIYPSAYRIFHVKSYTFQDQDLSSRQSAPPALYFLATRVLTVFHFISYTFQDQQVDDRLSSG
jgi:hypothetical protein